MCTTLVILVYMSSLLSVYECFGCLVFVQSWLFGMGSSPNLKHIKQGQFNTGRCRERNYFFSSAPLETLSLVWCDSKWHVSYLLCRWKITMGVQPCIWPAARGTWMWCNFCWIWGLLLTVVTASTELLWTMRYAKGISGKSELLPPKRSVCYI